MAHPIFEATTLPWSRPEVQAVWRTLANAIQHSNRILLLVASVGGDCSMLPPSGAPCDLWQSAIEHLFSRGQLRALCEAVLRDNSYSQCRAAILAMVNASDQGSSLGSAALASHDARIARRARAQAVVSSCCFGTSDYFVDRQTVRDALVWLADDEDSRKVLAVRGPVGGGRSWVARLVQAYAAALGDGCVVLDRDVAPTVDDAVARLCDRLETKAPPGLSTDAAWLSTVFSALFARAKQSSRAWWIVVDDCSCSLAAPTSIDPQVIELASTIAMNLRDEESRRYFRVVFLAFDGDKPPTRVRRELFCSALIDGITEEDVIDAVQHVVGLRGQRMLDDDARAIAKRALREQSSASADVSPLEALQSALRAELSLKAGGGA